MNCVDAPLTPKQGLWPSPLGLCLVTEDVPSPSRPGPDGSEQGWGAVLPARVRASHRCPVTSCSLCSPQRRVELHWEDFQRGGPAGILRVREFYTPRNCHGAGSTNRRVLNPQAAARPVELHSMCAADRQNQSCPAPSTTRLTERWYCPSSTPGVRGTSPHPNPTASVCSLQGWGRAQGWPSGGLQLVHRHWFHCRKTARNV